MLGMKPLRNYLSNWGTGPFVGSSSKEKSGIASD